MAYVGRVAVEKNIDGLSRPEAPGHQVGHRRRAAARGARSATTRKREVRRLPLGAGAGAACCAGADVLVFPSLTDTFGLAMIEALACGVPVAAFPVPGPDRCHRAGCDRRPARGSRRRHTLRRCSSTGRFARSARRHSPGTRRPQQFLAGLEPIPRPCARSAGCPPQFRYDRAHCARAVQPSETGDAN